MSAPISELEKQIRDRTLDQYGLIGSEGYTIPDVRLMSAFSFGEVAQGALRNVTIESESNPENNFVFVNPETPPERPVRIIANAKTVNARIILGDEFTLRPILRLFGPNPLVVLSGGRSEMGHSGEMAIDLWERDGVAFFGRGSTTNSSRISIAGPACSVLIGDDCMFADGISITTHDMHAVVDMTSNQMINPPGDVIIEPHVWLGRAVSVTKRTIIGLGSVVGSNSLVTKDVARFTVVGGVPARIIRTNATWDRMGFVREGTVQRLKELADAVPQT